MTSEAAAPSYVPTVLYVTSGVNTLWKLDPTFPNHYSHEENECECLPLHLGRQCGSEEIASQASRAGSAEHGGGREGKGRESQHYNCTLFQDLQMTVYSGHSSMCGGLLRCGLRPKKASRAIQVLTIKLHSKYRHWSCWEARSLM